MGTKKNPFKNLTKTKATEALSPYKYTLPELGAMYKDSSALIISDGVSNSYRLRNMPTAIVNRILYDGDHWGNGLFWMGPMPIEPSKGLSEIHEEIRKIFCSRNVIAEVINRKVDGLLSREPMKVFNRKDKITEENPITSEQSTLAEKFTDHMFEWWKKRNCLEILKEAVGRSYLGEKAVLRLYVPQGLLDDVVNEDGSTGKAFIAESLEEALDMIHIEVAYPGTASIITDKSTQMKAGVFQDLTDNSDYVELTYLNESRETVIRSIGHISGIDDSIPEKSAASDEMGTEFAYNIGGRLTMYEINLPTLITEQIRENNLAINLAKTMQNRNVITGGFVERIILDAMPPGRWVKDPDDPDKGVYEVGPFKVGPGSTNFYMSAEYRDEEGKITLGKPQVYFRDPSPPGTFIDSKRDCYQDILEEVGQPHVLISGDATSSGVAREQAAAVFRATLLDDKGEVDAAVEWLMETPMAWAESLTTQTNTFETLSAKAECFVNTGSLSAAERQEDRADVKEGLLSRKRAMARNGVDNPQAEQDQILSENETSEVVSKDRAVVFGSLVEVGTDRASAAKVAKYTDDEVQLLTKVDPDWKEAQKPIVPQTLNPPNPSGKNEPLDTDS